MTFFAVSAIWKWSFVNISEWNVQVHFFYCIFAQKTAEVKISPKIHTYNAGISSNITNDWLINICNSVRTIKFEIGKDYGHVISGFKYQLAVWCSTSQCDLHPGQATSPSVNNDTSTGQHAREYAGHLVFGKEICNLKISIRLTRGQQQLEAPHITGLESTKVRSSSPPKRAASPFKARAAAFASPETRPKATTVAWGHFVIQNQQADWFYPHFTSVACRVAAPSIRCAGAHGWSQGCHYSRHNRLRPVISHSATFMPLCMLSGRVGAFGIEPGLSQTRTPNTTSKPTFSQVWPSNCDDL